MDPVILSGAPPEHPILDYAALLQKGVAALERLAGDQWTDFNAHDPGITLLEAVCYALTDLGYRIFHPMEDLLAEAGPDAQLGLFTPAQALTCHAVSAEDLRRVVLDIPGVRNAWAEKVERAEPPLRYNRRSPLTPSSLSIEPNPASPLETDAIALSGLWRILVEKSDAANIDATELLSNVAHRLHAHRGLCEDFAILSLLEPVDVAVHATVEIGDGASGDDILRDIFERVGTLISPPIDFRTLEQVLGTPTSVEQAFEGPAPTQGFIAPDTLPELHRHPALHVSNVLREIMAIPGVQAVHSIRLASGHDAEGEPWSLKVEDTAAPRLHPESCRIRLVRKGLALIVKSTKVIDEYRKAQAASVPTPLPPERREGLIREVGRLPRASPPIGRWTRTMPRIYGVGPGSLPETASPRRRAQANQLRAYLTLFDQLIANQFAQLASLSTLLSPGHAGCGRPQLLRSAC